MSNLDIFKKANKVLGDGNYEKFITYCSDDIKWENVGERTFQGKIEVLEYIGSTYDGVVFTTENYITEKEFVVELGQIVFEQDGAPKKSSFCDVWKFKDGLIHQVTSFVI
ncbi:nuclear transport factor 2 family protein [Muricauda oceani]|uniref:Nuclear transport factor 2 family protein n=1 Tax=Flagellimonas oceani TaxID=2698672 RepID=A0A6G7IZ78_9FLAO|nr:nuclear transport factor 2 family protein [Allomuricauda oceani]MBW8244773.1 nuclear transport factor 2 family protein [Allomuricauda oceani]QII43913.1 nuclear transport factor 2 family protein [Allomuricauda oceani]